MKLALTFFLFSIMSLSTMTAQTVFITETGKKYHTKNCESLLKTEKKSISLKEAIKQGYDPCKVCKADQIILPEEKKKSGAKK